MVKLRTLPRSFTRVIAERALTLADGNMRRRVTIQIGEPVQDVATVRGSDWRCPVRITGLATGRIPPGIGIDSMQAVVHALFLVQVILEEAEEGAATKLLWLNEHGHGFPEVRLTGAKSRRARTPAQPTRRGPRRAERRKR